jgi:ParB family transcriptional regulator, chromosome partitioning protein
MEKRPALGKGLSALIPDAGDALSAPRASMDVDIDLLEPNTYQPRGQMDQARLQDLANSIRANGVIQPIVVRRAAAPAGGGSALARDRYAIIAGERRWRAAQLAGLRQVPIVVKDVAGTDKKRLLAMALIENIQREDLNPMEAAAGYQRLIDEFKLTQDAIAAEVGKDRATVANYLRLLKLPAEVQANVASGELSMGHARAIVALATGEEQRRVARDVVSRGLSVRETEALVKHEIDAASTTKGKAEKPQKVKDVHTRAAEEQLRLALGAPVEIRRKGKGGVVTITFGNENELQRIYEYLTDRKA